jgi:hypothetical protein
MQRPGNTDNTATSPSCIDGDGYIDEPALIEPIRPPPAPARFRRWPRVTISRRFVLSTANLAAWGAIGSVIYVF